MAAALFRKVEGMFQPDTGAHGLFGTTHQSTHERLLPGNSVAIDDNRTPKNRLANFSNWLPMATWQP